MRRCVAALLLLFALAAAAPPRLIADLSQNRIDIEYSFSGADLLVFGAIQYPGGKTPRSRPGLVVIVRGPPEPITVRRKERVAGIWINTRAVRFESAPSFFHVASNAPIEELVDERTAAIYELGTRYLQLSPASDTTVDEIAEFETGLRNQRIANRHYAEAPDGVELTEGVLYRARIQIPADVPVGAYTVETHLVRDGEVVASTTGDVAIEKTGVERFVYVAAHRRPVAYGLVAVAAAVLLGWSAGALMRR